ncbi:MULTISPECIES: hypothetical protein [unclassified Microbacterium]|uniref:hypothetical protein n=1 Tax=unclassified Microbacterium TaxID=2609290 RepID=UPI00214C304D|nr:MULTISPECIES: hypothetical protein [unclassified Microbacterium]MCR2783543.1 hypothetical protein [Microbacterium sp. zg.B96]WIM15596.1 hypothetical protein QNO11_13805 [Microbacterium sp. zg-B96]
MSERIDRAALAARHRVTVRQPHPEHVLTVGNGDFGYNADITGMQTFADFHDARRAMAAGAVAVNTATMSNWGWHEMPNPEGYTIEDAMTTYDTTRGPVRYLDKHDMMGAMSGNVADEFKAGAWLNANPQRMDLGRVGLELRHTPGDAVEDDPAALADVDQSLDLWTGMISSAFSFDGEAVHVQTVASPDDSVVAFRITSRLLMDGRARVVLRFPYASDGFFQTDDWDAHDRHTSTLDGDIIYRRVDDFAYVVEVSATDGILIETAVAHEFVVAVDRPHIDLVVRFGAAPSGLLPSFPEVARASADAGEAFWMSGAALDLSASADPRAHEFERRVVLSQYLTRVHSAGHLPPQETGLVTNSWQGKFHLEMHLWHAAHFAVWGRPELLERSLEWYLTVVDEARATAAMQGYPGARWPKQTGPDGRESPSDIGALLVWQQPHILHLLELVWQASSPEHREYLVATYGDLVDATATFMAAFAVERDGVFHLGPPIMPAQEFYDARKTVDPTFELAYWWWGLDIAQTWRERAGVERDARWQAVQDGLASPCAVDGRYTAVATDEPLRRDDHPSLLMALGVLPPTPIIDPELMKATLGDVWETWDWPTAWGWDFPVMAMTATRLGDPALAIDALLRDEQKNGYTVVGHNPQMRGILPLYLPGNGGLLLAVALLVQSHPAPEGWAWRAEGFERFPEGCAFDSQRVPQKPPVADAAATAPVHLTAEATIGGWLEHARGGELLRNFLAQTGTSAESLTPLRGVPLRQLVALSRGRVSQEAIDALVQAAQESPTPAGTEGE